MSLELFRIKAMSQQQRATEKVELKYHAPTSARPSDGFGFGNVTTGQVSMKKYEILARASSVGRFEERGDLNPDLMRVSTSARASPAPGQIMAAAAESKTAAVIQQHQQVKKIEFSFLDFFKR